MKRLTASFLLFALILILADEPAYSWGAKGHQIVACIAEAYLTDASERENQETTSKRRTSGTSSNVARPHQESPASIQSASLRGSPARL
jgi:hypothetical protein